jgi:hypothetical protein
MTFVDLVPLIINTEFPVNVIELYLYSQKEQQEQQEQQEQTKNIIDLCVSSSIVQKIERSFKNPKITEYKSYYMNDKIYTYELQNDNQIVTSKHKINMKSLKRHRKDTDVLIISYRIEKYPIYTFPCTNEIDYISTYTIKEYKINNRITINIKIDEEGNNMVYIEYKHSDNVELDRINETIGRLLNRI